ncbi:MAG: hypothetical protein AAGH68_04155 [Pseudomonadota bacterium]
MTTGRLAIWNDCAPGEEAGYEAWYQGEHLAERVGIPGFLRGRRYRAHGKSPEYFTYYEVTEPGVLTSPAYLARVNDPTPATRRIMAEVFRNMSRTICDAVSVHGHMRGAFAVTLPSSPIAIEAYLDLVTNANALARLEIWEAVPDATGTNAEQALRGPDKTIAGCVFAEFLEQGPAETFAKGLEREGLGPPGIFSLLCELQA